MHRLAAIFILVSTATCYSIKRYDDYCHGLECPRYAIINSTASYEVRHYPSFKWATASSKEKSKYSQIFGSVGIFVGVLESLYDNNISIKRLLLPIQFTDQTRFHIDLRYVELV